MIKTLTRSESHHGVQAPPVSVIVPVKNSQATIRLLVDSLLAQDYRGTVQIVLAGDVHDATWTAVAEHIAAGQVIAVEAAIHTTARESDAKRSIGLAHATGEILALTDSDMVLPVNWVSTGVELITEGHHAVAGSMIDIDSGFWRRHHDDAPPDTGGELHRSYLLTADTLGRRGLQPPRTANFFCDREVISAVGGPDENTTRTSPDDPWFQRMIRAGYPILWDDHLAGYHLHHTRTAFASFGLPHRHSGSAAGNSLAELLRRSARRRFLHLGVTLLIGLAAWTGLLLAPVWTVLGGLAIGVTAGLASRWRGVVMRRRAER